MMKNSNSQSIAVDDQLYSERNGGLTCYLVMGIFLFHQLAEDC